MTDERCDALASGPLSTDDKEVFRMPEGRQGTVRVRLSNTSGSPTTANLSLRPSKRSPFTSSNAAAIIPTNIPLSATGGLDEIILEMGAGDSIYGSSAAAVDFVITGRTWAA